MSREFTLKAVILGIFLAIVFGAANTYLGLKMGMTVSASIPAAVVSMAILRGILRRGTILENNIVQTIASAGESLAAGVIFTIPALILLGLSPRIFYIFLVSLAGGLLGVLLMVLVRKRFIEDEHDVLPYPEGRACAEVLRAGDEGGGKAKFVFQGIGLGFVYKLLSLGMEFFQDTLNFFFSIKSRLQFSFDNSPALLGVGFILGRKISFLVLSGGLFGWFALLPLIQEISPSAQNLMPMEIWDKYLRYVGAGGVFAGGLISFSRAIFSFFSRDKGIKIKRFLSPRDIPFPIIVIGVIVLYLFISFVPVFKQNLFSSFFIIIFAFLFIVVSSRIVGIVGSSSNPVSGMTIATLIIVSFILYKTGAGGTSGMITALTTGAIVCIAAAIAGDTSQDLKTGFLVGATPRKQQIGEFIGVITSALFIGWTLFLLHKAYTIGSEQLSAPQATLMKLVVQGVFEGTMPWALILTGIAVAIAIELLGIPALPFAVGLYLPLALSTTIGAGGVVAHLFKKGKEKGILFSSGLVAGDALAGIGIALVLVSGFSLPRITLPFSHSPLFGLLFLIGLVLLLYYRSK